MHKKISKIQYIQMLACIIPFIAFVLATGISYYYCFMKYKKNRLFFFLILFGATIVYPLVTGVVSISWLQYILSVIVVAIHNILQVILQVRCFNSNM